MNQRFLPLIIILSVGLITACRKKNSDSDASGDDGSSVAQDSQEEEFQSEIPVGLTSVPNAIADRSDIPLTISLFVDQPSDRTITANEITVGLTSSNQNLIADNQLSYVLGSTSEVGRLAELIITASPLAGSYGQTEISVDITDEFGNVQSASIPVTLQSPFGEGTDGDVTSTGAITAGSSAVLGRTFAYIDRIASASNGSSTSTLTLATSFTDDSDLKVGDEVMWHVTASKNICQEYAGKYGFAKVLQIDGAASTVTIDRTLPFSPDNTVMPDSDSGSDFCHAQLVRVPHLQNFTLGHSLGIQAFDKTIPGGILVLRIAGTFTLNAGGSILGNGKGFVGGRTDERGMSISSVGRDPLNRNPNGLGGGANSQTTNAEGGGGGSMVANGGGPETVNDGIGGSAFNCTSNPCSLAERALFGGGGGGGSDQTSSDGDGGGGGGILIIYAKSFVGAGGTIASNGLNGKNHGNGPSEDGGGGGAGVVGLIVENIDAATTAATLRAVGGNRGTGAAGGGAGGHVYLAWCSANTDNGAVTADVSGGLGNGINNDGNAGIVTRQALDNLCEK